MNNVTDVIKRILGDKKKILLLLLALMAALLIFIPQDKGKSIEETTLSEYKQTFEKELAELCSSIDGVGRCRVSVSFAEGESFKYNGGKIVSSSPPRVQGITVICDGGDDDRVRAELCDCMTALFDIGSNRVCVLRLK
ncbi:MAG: hypothetical protein E7617_02000 [Ruminococcaceae bacterium]|nr:hypothetical protein [Oscillospiraceae bacterium]